MRAFGNDRSRPTRRPTWWGLADIAGIARSYLNLGETPTASWVSGWRLRRRGGSALCSSISFVYSANPMGYPDQFAKQTFAEETEVLTGGAVVWQPMPEIGLIEVRGDGLLVVRDPARLGSLTFPWPL